MQTNGVSAWEALCQDNHIVLTGDAGAGKSVMMRHISVDVKKHGGNPIFISLKSYPNCEPLNALLDDTGMLPPYSVLILDGLDEIKPELQSNFLKKVEAVSERIKQVKTIIATRRNVYNGELSKFEKYSLAELTADDCRNYLQHFNIDEEAFMCEVNRRQLSDNCKNAFYFTHIVQIWRDRGCLPNAAGLMQTIIDDLEQHNSAKYDAVHPNFQEERPVAHRHFERIAMVLQLTHRLELSQEEYNLLLPPNDQHQLNPRGIWQLNEDGQWAFIHNNFREYYAARYLRRCNFDDILSYIATSGSIRKVKPSWINVVSFLALDPEKHDLWMWIQANEPTLINLFEKSRYQDRDVFDAFQTMCDAYEASGRWFSDDIEQIKKLAEFCANPLVLQYILEKLQSDMSHRHTMNLLHVLAYMPLSLGYEQEIYKTTMRYFFDDDTSYKIAALHVMRNMPALFVQAAPAIVNIGKSSDNTSVTYYVYSVLSAMGLEEDHIDMYLENIARGAYRQSIKNISVFSREKEVLGNVSQYAILEKVFAFWEQHKELLFSDRYSDVFVKNCKAAASLYKEDKDQLILHHILGILHEHFWNLQSELMNAVKEYMLITHTESAFVQFALEQRNGTTWLLYSEFMCETVASIIAKLYMEEQWPDKKELYERLEQAEPTDNVLSILQRAVHKKTGKVVHRVPLRDWNKETREGKQRIFDSLFDPALFDILVSELGEIIGTTTSLCPSDNHHDSLHNLHNNQMLFTLYMFLRRCFHETPDATCENYREYIIDWNALCVSGVCYLLQDHDANIEIKEAQRIKLQNFIDSEWDNIDFGEEQRLSAEKNTLSSRLFLVLQLAQVIEYPCPEAIAERLLLVVPYWDEERMVKIPAYIISNLDPNKLGTLVVQNLQTRKLRGNIACAHIIYCTEHMNASVMDAVLHFLETAEDRFEKECAVQYIYHTLGADAMFTTLLPMCQSLQLIDAISNIVQVNEYSCQFTALLFEEYQATNNEHYLSLLIQANHLNAVEMYYQLAHEKNAIPDYSEGDNMPVLTESIKEVRDPALTPLLIQLLKLSMQEGFIDKDMFGLNWACRQALRAIAMHDTEMVLQELETAKEPYNQGINQLLIDLIDNFSYYLVNSADEALDFNSALMIVPLRT